MCKEMPVIPVNRVVDKKKNNWKTEGARRSRAGLPDGLFSNQKSQYG
jgi:hypothetical protein